MKDILGWKFPDYDNLLSRKVQEFPKTEYQQTCIDAALLRAKEFNLAIDIGANVGLHSVRFAEYFNKVISFEPSQINFECLVENTKNFNNIDINKKAVGFKEDTLELVLPEDCYNCGAYSFVDFKDYNGKKSVESVEVITLDSLNLAPDLIKIDTQGFEYPILLGALTTITKHKPVMIIEIEFSKNVNQILGMLSPLGYEIVCAKKKDKVFAVIGDRNA